MFDTHTGLHTPGTFNYAINERDVACHREIVAHLFNYIITANFSYVELARFSCDTDEDLEFLVWCQNWLQGAGKVNWKAMKGN